MLPIIGAYFLCICFYNLEIGRYISIYLPSLEVLTNEGYGILRAYSGTEAVMLLSGTVPDLVLLDLMLPGLRDFS